MNEQIQHEYYQQKSFKYLIANFGLLVLLSSRAYENIVDNKLGVAVFFGILSVVPIMMITIEIIHNKKTLTEPGLIINEEVIKVKLGGALKYKIIKIEEITSVLVGNHDNIIHIYKGKSKTLISLYEYKKDELEAIKAVFRELGVEVANKSL